MKIVVSVLLVAISFSAMGQIDQQKLLYLGKVEKFRKMRNLGLALTVAGIGCGVYGMVKIIEGNKNYNATGVYTTTAGQEKIFIAGAPLFSAGLPIGLIGLGKMKQYEKKLRNVTLNLNYSPRQYGLALTYKF